MSATKFTPRSTSGWIGILVILLLLTEQTGLATALFASALPKLGGHFQTPHIVWVLSITTLVGSIVTPLAGRLADLYGKKRILVALSAIATVGSIISATASSWEAMLFGRALSGVSMAFLPLGYSLIQDIFPERLRSIAIAASTNGLGLITVVGPLIAGVMIDTLGVMSIFWPMVLLSLAGMILMILFVPETTVRAKGSADWFGAVLLGAGLGGILYALDMAPSWGWASNKTLIFSAAGLVLIGAWVAWERVCSAPLVDIRVLTNPVVLKLMLAAASAMTVIPGIASIFPLMLMTPPSLGIGYGLGVNATQVAFHTLLGGSLLVLGGLWVGATSHRIQPAVHIAIGGICLVAASVFFACLHSSSWHYVIAYGLMGLGGMILAACPILIVTVVPAEFRGVCAALLGATTSVAGTLGTQLTFSIIGTEMVSFSDGFPIYRSAGFTMAFSILAVIALIAIVAGVSLGKPHGAERTLSSASPVP
ncbi:MFS transporter [Pseudomonas sp. B26140]|uniref:MFS transporter n=1 Tax=Pseudomonas sp. B26140 TaxID=3235112 RepID=UPI0037835339